MSLNVRAFASPYTDNFNRSNGTLGSNWNPGTSLSIVSNQVTQTTLSFPNNVEIYKGAFLSDTYSQISVGSGSAGGIAPIVRFQSTGNFYYAYYNNSNSLAIWKSVSGTGTQLSTTATISTLSVGDIIKLEVIGTTLNAYINGSLIVSVTDSTYTSGPPGFLVNQNGVADNWQGASIFSAANKAATGTSSIGNKLTTGKYAASLTLNYLGSSISATSFGTGNYTTSSFAIPDNSLVLLAILAESNASGLSSPTVSGGSLSWTNQLLNQGEANEDELSFWTAPVTTGGSMTFTIGHSGDNIYEYQVFVMAFTNYNVSTPIGAMASALDLSGGSPYTVTLNATPDINSIIVQFCMADGSSPPDPVQGTGYSLLNMINNGSDITSALAKRPAGSTSTDASWATLESTTSSGVTAIAIEIKSA